MDIPLFPRKWVLAATALAMLAMPLPALIEAPNGVTVEGEVLLVKTSSSGAETIIRGRDLSNVVTYLVPDGHEVRPQIPSAKAYVSQKGAQFRPSVLAVVQGQVVDFPNDDNIDHNVFSFSKAKRFDLGLYKKGMGKSVTFDQAGPVALFCSIHSNMNAYLYVCPNHLFALSDRAGRFIIHGVPAGRYKVFAWHANLPEGRESVEILPLSVEKKEKIVVKIGLGTWEDRP